MTGERTILRGTTVIDVHDGSAHRAVDVTIDGGRIASVTTTSDDHPAGVTVIDAQETYAVPGFCDMHAYRCRADATPGVVRAGRYYSPETLTSTMESIAGAHSAV